MIPGHVFARTCVDIVFSHVTIIRSASLGETLTIAGNSTSKRHRRVPGALRALQLSGVRAEMQRHGPRVYAAVERADLQQ